MALKEEGRVAHSVWISTALFLLSAKRGCSRPAGGTSLSGRGKQASQASQASTAVFRNPTIGALPQGGGGADRPALEGTVQRGRRCWRGANSTVTVQAGRPCISLRGQLDGGVEGHLAIDAILQCQVKPPPSPPLPSGPDEISTASSRPRGVRATAKESNNTASNVPSPGTPTHLHSSTTLPGTPPRHLLPCTGSACAARHAALPPTPTFRNRASSTGHWIPLEAGRQPSITACLPNRTHDGTFATTPRVQGLHNTDRTQQATRRHGGSAGSRPRRIEIQYSPNMHWTSSTSRDRGTTGCVSCHCLATGTGGRYLPGRLSCFNIWVVLSTGGSMSRQNLGFGLMYIGMYCHLDAELDAGPRGRHVISPRNQTDADAGCKVPSQAPPSPRRWETVPPLHSPLGTSIDNNQKKSPDASASEEARSLGPDGQGGVVGESRPIRRGAMAGCDLTP